MDAGASAALLAGILHDGLTTVRALKEELDTWGVPVRLTPSMETGS
jgi:imidazole glycerol phosphate synthase subunit HisF